MLPLLVLCTLGPVYIPYSVRYLVSLAQMALQVLPLSPYALLPISRGLVRKLVVGWPAAYKATAGLNQRWLQAGERGRGASLVYGPLLQYQME